MWLALSLMAVTLPLVLFLLGRRDQHDVRRDWERLLTPRGEQIYRLIEARTDAERARANLTCQAAFIMEEVGSIEEAKHLLDVGYQVIERYSPNLLKLVAAMATFSRMVSIMASLTPASRWRLRIYTVRQSLALVARFLRHPTARITDPEIEEELRRWPSTQDDFQALADEARESGRAVLGRLGTMTRSGEPLWQWAERREQWREPPEREAARYAATLLFLALIAGLWIARLYR